jgi:hypothetical protein
MRLASLGALALLAAGAGGEASAQARESGVRFFGSVTMLSLDHAFAHDTHPDDASLPSASVPGSAGVTSLDDEVFYGIGAGYSWVSENMTLTADLSWMTGPRDERQNANDTRPPAQASFVYSTANAITGAAAATWNFGMLDAGIEAQAGAVWIDAGWDRFDKDENDDTEIEGLLTAGVRAGIEINRFRIEASAFTGTHTGAQARVVLAY